MPNHEYTPKDTLDLLIKKIEVASPALVSRIRLAIDAGRDIRAEETIVPGNGRRRAKKWYFRKHVPYTNEEALAVAMAVLEAHLIESRLLVNAARDEFTKVGLTNPKRVTRTGQPGAPMQPRIELDMELSDEVADVLALGEQKEIRIEAEPEAVLAKKDLADLRFQSTDEHQLRSLREIFQRLKVLTNFRESNHGNPR